MNKTLALLCIVLLSFACVALIFAGVLTIVIPNDRQQVVAEYEARVGQYNTLRSTIQGWSGTAQQGTSRQSPQQRLPLRVLQTPVVILGDSRGIPPTTSTHLAIDFPSFNALPNGSGVEYVLDAGDQGNISFTRNYPWAREQREILTCDRDACGQNCGGIAESIVCTNLSMTRECQRRYHPLAVYVGVNTCNFEESCGQCRYTQYAVSFCAVVELSGSDQLIPSPSKKSCYYPFDEEVGIYTSEPQTRLENGTVLSPVTVEVRLASDPMLVVEELTEGTADFGISRASQNATGYIFIAVGVACLLVVIIACYKFRSVMEQEEEAAKKKNTTFDLTFSRVKYEE